MGLGPAGAPYPARANQSQLDRRYALFGLCFYSLLAYISTAPAAASMAAVAVPGLTHEQ